MICIICNGEEIEVQAVREEIAIGSDLVYVPIHVPVCQTCGERYFDRKTVRYLEEVERKLREGNGELEEVGRLLMYG